MKALRFDFSGAMGEPRGISREAWEYATRLAQDSRVRMLEAAKNQEPRLAFLHQPYSLLEAYSRTREASEMGRVFAIANSQMDLIDAVVVVASKTSQLTVRAMFDACCDPLHNQLMRGPRGGKPRLYFAGDHMDTEATRSLLCHLKRGGYGETEAERRWGLVIVLHPDDPPETLLAANLFLEACRDHHRSDDERWFRRLVVPVFYDPSMRRCFEALNLNDAFLTSPEIAPSQNVFTMPSILPAAMLGLDVMKFLEGAWVLSQNFEQTPVAENITMQFAAINHLVTMPAHCRLADGDARDASQCILETASLPLRRFVKWYHHLRSSTVDRHVPSADRHPPSTSECTAGPLVHRLFVQRDRTDPIRIPDLPRIELDGSTPMRGAGQDLSAILAEMLAAEDNGRRDAGCLTTRLGIPTLNPFLLGQLFQCTMIATALEREMADTLGQSPRDAVDVREHR